jgi:hypothetical protein
MNDKTAKKIVGITALTAGAYLALKATSKKEEEGFGSGNFAGLGGGGLTTEGLEGTDNGGQPININFPAFDPLPIFPDKRSIAPASVTESDIVEDVSGVKDSTPTTKKDSLIKSSSSKLSEAYDKATKTVTIEPMTLKSSSTKTAIAARSEPDQPWSLSESSIKDVKGYVGTPANVVDEQIKKVKESLGTNVISQPGNTFSEYTAEEKARSKTQMSFFDKVIGKITSPMKEEPRVVTAAKNIVSPAVQTVVKNITTTPTAWSRGTVKTGSFASSSSETYDPSNPSGAKETLQTTKKEATTKRVVSLQEAASRSYDDLVSKASGGSSSSSSSSSSSRSSGSSGSSKSSTTTTKKKVVSLKQAKTVRDD